MSATSNQALGEYKDCKLFPSKHSEQQSMTSNFTVMQGVSSSEGILSMLRHHHHLVDLSSASTSSSTQQQQQQQNSFPVFPALRPPVLKSVGDTPALQMNSHDIAKEAMRLTRETLLAEEQQHLAETIEFSVASPKEHNPPTSSNRKIDGSSSGSEDEAPMALPKMKSSPTKGSKKSTGNLRLNKFVRRLHDMLVNEKDSGVVEWRRGLLVLQNTDVFAKQILPKYFNTRNFKTFRRQLNYYAFVHVRSFSNSGGNSTTALWVNKDLTEMAEKHGTNPEDISSVLLLKRVEPCDTAKTAEGRRVRKKMAISVVEEDLGVSAKSLQLQQLKSLGNSEAAEKHAAPANHDHYQTKHEVALEHHNHNTATSSLIMPSSSVPLEIHVANYSCNANSGNLQDHTASQRTVSMSSADESFLDPDQAVTSPKPPTSSRSAANLLLLLSKT